MRQIRSFGTIALAIASLAPLATHAQYDCTGISQASNVALSSVNVVTGVTQPSS
jgi:hypothetical protein